MATRSTSGNIEVNNVTTMELELTPPVLFRQFDVVSDYSDHYYAKNKYGDCFGNAASRTYKKIMAEWKILQKSLPESIFVLAYEGRIDLLRAVIIGASGTPYHDGLFFFDIKFHSDYPATPPSARYRSFGVALNPNLYANGYVCLSLLNTWHGSSTERWDPSKSTILQVVVSLQALVLNAKPYYNEPLFIKPAWSWEKYNEKVFELSCTTMCYVLGRPPKNFESFVSLHFLNRAETILRACKAYRDGCVRVGFYHDEGLPSSGTIKVSGAFKGSMERIYQCLFVAFTKNGASLQDFEPSLQEKKGATGSSIKSKKLMIVGLCVCITILIIVLLVITFVFS